MSPNNDISHLPPYFGNLAKSSHHEGRRGEWSVDQTRGRCTGDEGRGCEATGIYRSAGTCQWLRPTPIVLHAQQFCEMLLIFVSPTKAPGAVK